MLSRRPPNPVEDQLLSDSVAPRLDNPARGIVLLLLSTIFLSGSDVISKILSQSLPPIQISWLRFSSFLIFVLIGAAWRGPPRIFATRHPGLQIMRAICLLASSLTFITALVYLPVAAATATSFIWPIFVMALSIPLLGERVGIRRWLAAACGLIGVLIVVRPGTTAFQPAALLPVLSALIWALSMIITRRMSGLEEPMTTLAISALVGFLVLTLLLPFGWKEPTMTELLLGIVIGATSALGHFLVILACRFGSASVLAPFSYAQLVWATLLGMLFLNAVPDLWTLVGGCVIAASGLYTAHRERVRARDRLLAQAGRSS